jgi:hypothetical protein
VLSRLFRRLFLDSLRSAFDQGQLEFPGDIQPLRKRSAFLQYLAPVARVEWVVHAKPPFGGPAHVLEYLGRYTHRVALSNDRLLSIHNGQVSFRYKDYRIAGREKYKVMTLPEDEFIRRFLAHILPPGFQKIRFHGFLAHRPPRRTCLVSLSAPNAGARTAPRPTDYRDHYPLPAVP